MKAKNSRAFGRESRLTLFGDVLADLVLLLAQVLAEALERLERNSELALTEGIHLPLKEDHKRAEVVVDGSEGQVSAVVTLAKPRCELVERLWLEHGVAAVLSVEVVDQHDSGPLVEL